MLSTHRVSASKDTRRGEYGASLTEERQLAEPLSHSRTAFVPRKDLVVHQIGGVIWSSLTFCSLVGLLSSSPWWIVLVRLLLGWTSLGRIEVALVLI
jgi:hypothetical protein